MSLGKMPEKYKKLIRKMNHHMVMASELQFQIGEELEEEGVPMDIFMSIGFGSAVNQTEALSNIMNGQINTNELLEESIEDIEKVYMRYINENGKI